MNNKSSSDKSSELIIKDKFVREFLDDAKRLQPYKRSIKARVINKFVVDSLIESTKQENQIGLDTINEAVDSVVKQFTKRPPETEEVEQLRSHLTKIFHVVLERSLRIENTATKTATALVRINNKGNGELVFSHT